jgi:hypothetical protein
LAALAFAVGGWTLVSGFIGYEIAAHPDPEFELTWLGMLSVGFGSVFGLLPGACFGVLFALAVKAARRYWDVAESSVVEATGPRSSEDA